MPSRLTIKERINNALERKENTLNISFSIRDIKAMMQYLKIKGTYGTNQLAKAIVDEILKK